MVEMRSSGPRTWSTAAVCAASTVAIVERIVRNPTERYVDATTGRLVAVGRHGRVLVMIPYEQKGDELTPVTVHATSRQQVNARLRSGRFGNE